ncbi:MAG: GntR family transcriptional regulator [Acidocella sp.]|nr:GntR family transcriptional regulator [Acidocella sp.]
MPDGLTNQGSTTPRARAAEAIYAGLLADITNFRMLPGDRFTEKDVSLRFAASRTPVRDALFMLKRDGFVDVRFRSGWHVCPFDFERFDELYELRIVLETAAIERLCQSDNNARNEVVRRLEAIWTVAEAAREQEPGRLTQLDEGFHRALVEAAGNREMAAIHRDITDKIRIIRRLDFFKESRVDATYSEHARILRTLRRGLVTETLIMLRAHVTTSKQEVRKITLHMMHEARAASKPI